MPRVIAGAVGGRRLRPVPDVVRPTTDRTKEAMFSILQRNLPDARVLDLFAGSGALGIEALSRGAAHATFVESAPMSLEVIEENLADLDLLGRATVVGADALHAVGSRAPGPYEIVLADPPYRLETEVITGLLALLPPVLADGAVVVVERHKNDEAPTWPAGMLAREPRRYGACVLHIADRVTS